jgi:hypothetical protein
MIKYFLIVCAWVPPIAASASQEDDWPAGSAMQVGGLKFTAETKPKPPSASWKVNSCNSSPRPQADRRRPRTRVLRQR